MVDSLTVKTLHSSISSRIIFEIKLLAATPMTKFKTMVLGAYKSMQTLITEPSESSDLLIGIYILDNFKFRPPPFTGKEYFFKNHKKIRNFKFPKIHFEDGFLVYDFKIFLFRNF